MKGRRKPHEFAGYGFMAGIIGGSLWLTPYLYDATWWSLVSFVGIWCLGFAGAAVGGYMDKQNDEAE